MNPEEAVKLGILAIVICVPVLAITARLALRPIVDSIVRLREGYGPPPSAGVERRVLELEDEVRALRSSLARLEEASHFDQALAAPSAPPLRQLAGEAVKGEG
jgi:hypothetical protein